ncbi:S-adenosyl-L-methionine-dependent methyltransferase [Xylaria castorea]|nr:S-adenosyl-L-methionine-dependent methyltransferase [Xylaria castorea]
MPHEIYPYHPVITISEEDDLDGELSSVGRRLRDLRHAQNAGQRIPFIDLTQDEEQRRNVLQYEIRIIDELNGRNYRSRNVAPLRSISIPTRLELSSFRYNQKLIKRGTCVEVPQREQEDYCWQFLHVHAIYTDSQSHSVILRGIRLARHRHMRGLFPRFKNEVCALYDIDKKDSRHEDLQAAVEISVMQVISTRALSRTNDVFPSHRFNRSQWETIKDVENKAVLVQRWKHYRYWPTTEAMASKKSYSGAVVRLRCADIDDPHLRVADDKLRNEFRGGIIRGGSFRGGQAAIPTVDVDGTKGGQGAAALEHRQKYTADDYFCGAGGASCGIRRAGLQLRIACDMEHVACKTHRENFPEATLKQMNISHLIEESENSTDHSDCVHFSPPCQVWSPAHTQTGKDDEANVAALYTIEKVLERRRPRISTGEQTFGLLFDRNEEFFNALVGQYTALGFSFSWDILRFKEYGLPSIRRRLIWIASCPGEALPPFPMPTNAETGGELPAPVTLRDVLRKTRGSRRNDPLHDVELMLHKARNSLKFPRAPYDDRCQIGTVTTSGSEWAHPSGQRNFTLRELAFIQGFPRSHKFFGTRTQINRQIGNAFPPVVVEILYRHLRKWLLRQDRVLPLHRNVITLDPIEDAVLILQSSKLKNLIMIDDGDDEEYHNQGARVPNEHHTSVRVEEAILIDGSEDVDMMDLTDNDIVEDYPNFSRESSRTLSAESLPSLIEMEVDSEDNAPSVASRHPEGAHRPSLFYQN